MSGRGKGGKGLGATFSQEHNGHTERFRKMWARVTDLVVNNVPIEGDANVDEDSIRLHRLEMRQVPEASSDFKFTYTATVTFLLPTQPAGQAAAGIPVEEVWYTVPMHANNPDGSGLALVDGKIEKRAPEPQHSSMPVGLIRAMPQEVLDKMALNRSDWTAYELTSHGADQYLSAICDVQRAKNAAAYVPAQIAFDATRATPKRICKALQQAVKGAHKQANNSLPFTSVQLGEGKQGLGYSFLQGNSQYFVSAEGCAPAP